MLPSQLRKVGAGRLLQFPGLVLSMDTGGMSAGYYGATTPQLSKTLILAVSKSCSVLEQSVEAPEAPKHSAVLCVQRRFKGPTNSSQLEIVTRCHKDIFWLTEPNMILISITNQYPSKLQKELQMHLCSPF